MSLTSHINDKNSLLSQFLASHFPCVSPIQKAARSDINEAIPNTIRPAGQIHYGTIGTALDYRIRYYFEATMYTKLVGFHGAQRYYVKSQKNRDLKKDCMLLSGELPEYEPAEPLCREDQARRDHVEPLQYGAAAHFFANLENAVNQINPVGRCLEHQRIFFSMI